MTNNKPSSWDGDASGADRGFASYAKRRLVSIRTILARDVIGDLQDEYGEMTVHIDADATLYSVHDADGERLALVGDRELAFAAARQYEMTPVSVH